MKIFKLTEKLKERLQWWMFICPPPRFTIYILPHWLFLISFFLCSLQLLWSVLILFLMHLWWLFMYTDEDNGAQGEPMRVQGPSMWALARLPGVWVCAPPLTIYLCDLEQGPCLDLSIIGNHNSSCLITLLRLKELISHIVKWSVLAIIQWYGQGHIVVDAGFELDSRGMDWERSLCGDVSLCLSLSLHMMVLHEFDSVFRTPHQ